jgi:hypothetical protein
LTRSPRDGIRRDRLPRDHDARFADRCSAMLADMLPEDRRKDEALKVAIHP